ncbi:MAG: proton-conducting transporter membrane subunit [Pseudomonadota bacterium]
MRFETLLALTPVAMVIAFLIAALASARTTPRRAGALSANAGVLGVVGAVLMLSLYVVAGAQSFAILPKGWFAFGTRIDALSVIALSVVVGIGLVVIRFSRAYLDGNPRQHLFFAWLNATLAAVVLLVTAGTLLQLTVGWILTSLALHQLLVFFPERRRAVSAARKKFVFARFSDVALVGAAVLLWQHYGTADLGELAAAIRATGPSASVVAAAVFLSVAAMLKCAQFPTHGWLTEVMDTPTPVSALLHAGIVNGGGFLLIRFADVIVTSPAAMATLIIVGAMSASLASLSMLTQTNVKASLSYSTVSQMGFMLMQCGLGAFSTAAVHLVAHSLYKGHSFLASGNAVDNVQAWRLAGLSTRPIPGWVIAGALVTAAVIYVGMAYAAHTFIGLPFAVLALGFVYVFGLCVFLVHGATNQAVFMRVLPAALGATIAYLGLQWTALQFFAGTIPPAPAMTPTMLTLTIAIVVLFASVAWLQLVVPKSQRAWATSLYLAARNGFYINHYLSRMTGVFKRVTPSA